MATGIDTTWYLSSNELAYINSMKMKLAVILGVVHMTLGIVLRGCNSWYFNKKLDLMFEVIPQLVILVAMFGYMDILIIMKWLTDWTGREGKAPSIIQTMIAMFISFGATPEGTDPIIGTGKQQQTISLTLLILVVICVPVLLCCKPCLLHFGKQDHAKRMARISAEDEFDGVQLIERPATAVTDDFDRIQTLDNENRLTDEA
mmetsp:Transcript_7692/g.9249  ORF Transcript_7692/g.9249 Transcript_7692/m.9249 type:complete len:203 (+) Transcript_7692:1926-2534(+)